MKVFMRAVGQSKGKTIYEEIEVKLADQIFRLTKPFDHVSYMELRFEPRLGEIVPVYHLLLKEAIRVLKSEWQGEEGNRLAKELEALL